MDEENNNNVPENEPVEEINKDPGSSTESEAAGTEEGLEGGEAQQDNPHGLKEGYGRREYEKTIGNKDYYKNQAEELKQRQQQARMEQANRYKKKANGEDTDDSSKEGDSSKNSDSSKDKKELSKEERDEQKKSAASSDGEKKNLKDRAKDAKNTYAANKAVAQNKIDQFKSKAYKARHPLEAAKAEAKEKLKKKARQLLIKYWWVAAIAALILLLLLMIGLFILGMAEGDDANNSGYLDPAYDYTQTIVQLNNSYTNEEDKVELDRGMTLKDLVIGSVYYETKDKTEGLNENQLLEFYKAYCILFKTQALEIGGYSNETKKIVIQSGSDFNYCDPYNGCVIKEKDGVKTFVSKAYENAVDGEVIEDIEPMEYNKLSVLKMAYGTTIYEILTPKDVKEPITSYSYTSPTYDTSSQESIYEKTSKNKDYEKALEKTYSDYKVYDIRDYATYYTYTSSTAYWWPIGSEEATSGNIYGGTPTSTTITSEFSYRCIQGVCGNHRGIDIGGSYGQTVIIATRGGTVTTAEGGCDSTGSYGNTCNGGYGNYIIIDHGDGTSSVYAHMYKDSFAVSAGDKVSQGQKIGLMGSSGSSTGTHLHFEVRINGSQEDPLSYVDPANPRPQTVVGEGVVVNGNSNVETVCLTLKASGFSNEAVAGIMGNIDHESGFRTSVYGDNGTSAGLCQWHLGRLDNLKSYCGSNWSSDAGCQVKFLIYELQHSETNAYNALLGSGSAYDMGAAFCVKFERPADQDACYSVRGNTAQNTYYPYVLNNCSN